jgi:hypothetical protein
MWNVKKWEKLWNKTSQTGKEGHPMPKGLGNTFKYPEAKANLK